MKKYNNICVCADNFNECNKLLKEYGEMGYKLVYAINTGNAPHINFFLFLTAELD